MRDLPAKLPADLTSLLPPAPVGGFARFADGAATAWRGFQLLLRRPALWRYAVLPILFNLLITLIVIVMLVGATVVLFRDLHPWLTEGRTGGAWWVSLAVEFVLGVVFVIVGGAVALITWKLLSGILCGYFYGLLAEQVELALGADPDELRSIPLRYEIIDTLLNLTALVVVNLGVLLLNLIPLIGSAAALLVGAWCNWFLLGLDYLSFPLALRGVRRLDQIRYARRREAHTLGLGASVFLFEFIPLVGAVFLTSTVVGTVLLHRRLEASSN